MMVCIGLLVFTVELINSGRELASSGSAAEQPVVQEGEEICAHSDTYGFDQCRSGLEHEFDMR